MITKEDIEKRLEALKRDLQALDYRIVAVQGAIQDCEFWKGVLAKKEEEETNGRIEDRPGS